MQDGEGTMLPAMRQLPPDARFSSARVRVTLDCPECAAPIPVNGLVDQVLCAACQSVVSLEGRLGWERILTYQKTEPCMEHRILVNTKRVKAMDYFLAFGPQGGDLYRKWRQVLLEVDAAPPACTECRAPLDPDALGREAAAEGPEVDAFCPGCGAAIPMRVPSREERGLIHSQCVAIVGETAPRGDLSEPETSEQVLFSCLGCGAPANVDATVPRILRCEYCEATSYLPDALWLRLHPAQRKRPFYLILLSTQGIHSKAKKRL